jgi:hypothetical protein
MTGSWGIQINGVPIDEEHQTYGEYLKGHSEYGHMEGISIPTVIDLLIWKLNTGDILTLTCELAE